MFPANTVNDSIYLGPSGGLLREVMDAHGGFSVWHEAASVRAVMSTGGFLFLMRTTRDAFRRTEVLVDLRSPRTELKEFPRPGCTGFFESNRVWIEDADSKALAERKNVALSNTRLDPRPRCGARARMNARQARDRAGARMREPH
ncbi:MAG: hypothetical protein WCF10_09700 [Polyangiales bacterium]